jgi:hypothetical protein
LAVKLMRSSSCILGLYLTTSCCHMDWEDIAGVIEENLQEK